jgi:hypothetical protein
VCTSQQLDATVRVRTRGETGVRKEEHVMGQGTEDYKKGEDGENKDDNEVKRNKS